MKLIKKIISYLMITALIITALPLSVMAGSSSLNPLAANQSLVLNRPMASVVVSDVTRVAYAVNSMRQPTENNSVIVKATPSGIPYTNGYHVALAYAGETPAYTMVSFTPGVELSTPPTVACNNTTVTMSEYTYSNGTYVWQVTGGMALVGTTLIFTVSYSYSEVNSQTGKTYTNNYQSVGTSYVEAIASPAGMYSSKRTFENFGLGTTTKNRSYIGSYILGMNTYGSVYNDGVGDGSLNFTDNASWANAQSFIAEYGVMKNFSDTGSTRQYNVALAADTNRPITYVYMDKSIHSTLSDLNLRLQTVIPAESDEADERVTVSVNDIASASGVVSTYSGSTNIMTPTNDETVASALGLTKYNGSIKALGSNFLMYFSGPGPAQSNATTDYTVSVTYKTSAQWDGVYVGQSSSIRVYTYDKGALRTLVEEIQGTDPNTMTVTIPDGEFKGYNPQKWYYSSGWESFLNAYNAAKACLSKPNVNQTQIDEARQALSSAYGDLTLKKADYSIAEAYYNQAMNKNSANYTLASWAKLQTVIDSYCSDYSVLYQPAVDKLATDLKTNINNLVEANADYSDFLANLSTVNKLMTNAPIMYGVEASKAYSNWASLVSVLKNSGCVYNTVDGYVIDKYLTVSDQPTVDGYCILLTNAINALTLAGANYTEASKAESAYSLINLSYVVDDVVASLRTAYNNLVALHGLNLSKQNDINLATAELNYWLDNVEYKPSDTTAARALIATANGIDRGQYSDFTAVDNAVASLQSKLNLDIRYQSEIDRYTSALQSAIDKLTKNSADYSAVDEAIANAESIKNNIADTYKDSYGFTASVFYTNWSAVETAISNVVRGLDVTNQSTVDSYASAITNAIANLTESKADYTEVTKLQSTAADIVNNGSALYKSDSLDNLTNVYISVNKNLKISSQSVVDEYAVAIQNAIDSLEYLDANYSGVNTQLANAQAKYDQEDVYNKAHPGYSYYTQATLSALRVAVASVETGLDIRKQDTVNGFESAVKTAIDNLKFSPADYSQVDIAITQIPADTSLYTTLSVATLNATVNSINRNLTADKQSTVDKYVTSIVTAINNLKYQNADYTAVNTQVAKVPSDSSLYKEEKWQYVQTALDNIVYDLDIRYQADVDGYATALESALNLLEYKDGDYTCVKEAMMNVPFDLTPYSDESVDALNNTIDSVVFGLDITHQSEINQFAQNILDDVGRLVIVLADYTKYDTAVSNANSKIDSGLYEEDTVESMRQALKDNTMEAGLDKSHQNDINNAAWNINMAASGMTYKPGNYTQLDKAIADAQDKINSGYYTESTVEELQKLLDSVVKDLDISHQGDIDTMTANIVKATNDLSKKLADYTELQKILDLLDNSYSEIYTITYSNFDEIMPLINDYRNNTVNNNMNLPVDEQSKVDEMTNTLQGYIDSLKIQPEYFIAKEGSTTVIQDSYIYGLKDKLSKSAFERDYVAKANVSVTYSSNTNSRFLGSGTTVTVTSILTHEVIATYTIVIFGDVDGDGQITSSDINSIKSSLAGSESKTDLFKKVANINGDRYVNYSDAKLLGYVVLGVKSVDQVKGRVD